MRFRSKKVKIKRPSITPSCFLSGWRILGIEEAEFLIQSYPAELSVGGRPLYKVVTCRPRLEIHVGCAWSRMHIKDFIKTYILRYLYVFNLSPSPSSPKARCGIPPAPPKSPKSPGITPIAWRRVKPSFRKGLSLPVETPCHCLCR